MMLFNFYSDGNGIDFIELADYKRTTSKQYMQIYLEDGGSKYSELPYLMKWVIRWVLTNSES